VPSADDLINEAAGPRAASTQSPNRAAFEGNNPLDNPYTYKDIYGAIPGYDNRAWGAVTKPSAYEYGGQAGTADLEAQRYGNMAALADRRQGPQIDYNAGGQNSYDSQRSRAQQGEIRQGQALANYRDIINGNAPSVAALQQQQGLASANRMAAMQAGNVRGGYGLANAQMAAIQGAGRQYSGIGQQGAMARSGETFGALGGYTGLADAARAQGLQQGGVAANLGYQQAQLYAQQNALNDQRNMDLERMRQGVYQSQLAAQQAGEFANQGAYATTADLAARQQQMDAAQRNAMFTATSSGGGAFVSGLAAAQQRGGR
jgi:hypothetical protein